MTAPSKIFAPKNAPGAAPEQITVPSFTVREHDLIARLGLSRNDLRSLRAKHLTEGVHWQHCGRQTMLTTEGVEKIAAAARLPIADAPQRPPHLLTFPGFEPPLVVTLKAWRFYPVLKRRTIMEAYLPHTDPKDRRNVVRVRVKNSANFVQHMELPARMIQSPDLYECTRPAPRSRGRW